MFCVIRHGNINRIYQEWFLHAAQTSFPYVTSWEQYVADKPMYTCFCSRPALNIANSTNTEIDVTTISWASEDCGGAFVSTSRVHEKCWHKRIGKHVFSSEFPCWNIRYLQNCFSSTIKSAVFYVPSRLKAWTQDVTSKSVKIKLFTDYKFISARNTRLTCFYDISEVVNLSL